MADQRQEQGKKKEEPIIIKKVKGSKGHGHHGGSWKVAYADFVTAMMAFFIVMWILASSADVKQAVSAYFQDPGAFDFFTGKPIAIDLNLKPAGPGKGGSGEGEASGDDANAKRHIFQFSDEMADSVVNRLWDKAIKDSIAAAERVQNIKSELTDNFQKLVIEKPEIEELLESIKFELTDEGLRIELIESQESLFFEIGSSNLKSKAVDLLKSLGNELGKLPNHIEIEGHTDSRGYSGQSKYSNWELSADRANSARRVLENNGLWEGQVTKVTGFADRKLRNKDNPFDTENRRVSILIKYMSTDNFLPTAGNQ